jgi:hypothetical protein
MAIADVCGMGIRDYTFHRPTIRGDNQVIAAKPQATTFQFRLKRDISSPRERKVTLRSKVEIFDLGGSTLLPLSGSDEDSVIVLLKLNG